MTDTERLGYKPRVGADEFGTFDTLESAKRAAHNYNKRYHSGRETVTIYEVWRHKDTGVREYREHTPQKWDKEI